MSKKHNSEFYYAIDKLCIKKGMTHKELAEFVGVNEPTLSRYLTGVRKIPLSSFMRMCKVFNITAEELYKIYLFSNMERRVTRYRTNKKEEEE